MYMYTAWSPGITSRIKKRVIERERKMAIYGESWSSFPRVYAKKKRHKAARRPLFLRATDANCRRTELKFLPRY